MNPDMCWINSSNTITKPFMSKSLLNNELKFTPASPLAAMEISPRVIVKELLVTITFELPVPMLIVTSFIMTEELVLPIWMTEA